MGTRIHSSWLRTGLAAHAGSITFKPTDPEASPQNTLLCARISISVSYLIPLLLEQGYVFFINIDKSTPHVSWIVLKVRMWRIIYHVIIRALKITVFRDVAPCSLVETYRRFGGAYYLHKGDHNGGSKHLWNVGLFIRDYTAPYLRRLPSSYSPLWKSEISQKGLASSITVKRIILNNNFHGFPLFLDIYLGVIY
jgi:hypothetical protein